MNIPARAYARNQQDEKRLIAAGVPANRIYREDRGVEQWGAVIVDVETGLRSDRQSAKLLDLGLAKRHGERFKPPKLLRDMAKNGETFYGRFPPDKRKAA